MTNQSSGRRGLKIVLFALLRLLFFVVPLVALLYVGLEPYFSAICAALIGFALSLLLLQRQRDPVVELVYNKSHQRDNSTGSKADEDYEDHVVETYRQELDKEADANSEAASDEESGR